MTCPRAWPGGSAPSCWVRGPAAGGRGAGRRGGLGRGSGAAEGREDGEMRSGGGRAQVGPLCPILRLSPGGGEGWGGITPFLVPPEPLRRGVGSRRRIRVGPAWLGEPAGSFLPRSGGRSRRAVPRGGRDTAEIVGRPWESLPSGQRRLPAASRAGGEGKLEPHRDPARPPHSGEGGLLEPGWKKAVLGVRGDAVVPVRTSKGSVSIVLH